MTDKDLSTITAFIRNANRTNKSVKITKRIDCGILWSIDVRFLAVRSREISFKEANEIYDQIETLSKKRVIPNRDMREWYSGSTSPCQGEDRGFDPRLALAGKEAET